MNENLTELVFIIDKSGSMAGLEKETINGFNSLIEKQKNNLDTIVSTILFNDSINVIDDRVNIKDIKELTNKEYRVSGCTALLDAIGETINHIKNVQSSLTEKERPSKTLFMIVTDGMENSSKEYDYPTIKKMISESKGKNGYEFIFIGANIDSEEEASRLGIDKKQAVNYKNDSSGVSLNYCALGFAIDSLRIDKKLSSAWRKTIDNDFKKRCKNNEGE